MADLIDRQAAIDVLNKLARDNFTLKDAFSFYLGALHDASDGIKELPSVDAVPVVRCKYCALWNNGRCETWSNLGVTILTAETGYCNFGERREDE